ncbi:2-hydroxychromene-2-carboxylate isomerase [Exilibacterium tricleocarpae]|uniref:2-hydroxychromene-2-carboxylate isomerase n=1 Tax=Exilibacterium tricleocarpae TaxID=2591008 RepID=A0A545ST75_9GAMM|nr:2-hydroxychromene-2-carboxylate isomerase [Exilibacterium tricleocarpae]TQV68166.1 2-hydroxychromene-2-carboxylate isomerase [Exilibacterium tricleocarpae]
MARLEFWYDLASNYSYLSAMRIDQLAATAKVDIEWRPFLLGPVFKEQGWNTSPFNIYPAKGAYMKRDMQRIAVQRGLRFQLPEPFPARSLLATRLALLEEADDWTRNFCKSVFIAEFALGEDISNPDILSNILVKLGVETAEALATAQSPALKKRLREHTAEAIKKGVFGAPSFITEDGELFWGDDRLEQALAWQSNQSTYSLKEKE